MPSEAFPFTRLKDCGTIRSGQSFRKAPLEDSNSRHFVIQTKDLLPEGHISQTLMPVSLMGEKPKPNVEPGDLLILSRGVRFNAGVVGGLPGPSTALNMFYVFKPHARAASRVHCRLFEQSCHSRAPQALCDRSHHPASQSRRPRQHPHTSSHARAAAYIRGTDRGLPRREAVA